jgi:hypothetical protein
LQFGGVRLGVVAAEQKVAAGGEDDPHVSLGSTPVAAIRGG